MLRMRYYGFLGNRYRKEKLEQCRQLLGMVPREPDSPTEVAEPQSTISTSCLQ
jgi:hypothetical protein